MTTVLLAAMIFIQNEFDLRDKQEVIEFCANELADSADSDTSKEAYEACDLITKENP